MQQGFRTVERPIRNPSRFGKCSLKAAWRRRQGFTKINSVS
ncbi:hypothetical protein AB395_00005698 (plasmid) [Sinorhizobium fredii CCBAU 45436]|nr:hypothetical protein AB395_00005698 [Sinorhizobium fredii CCBAU 45436]